MCECVEGGLLGVYPPLLERGLPRSEGVPLPAPGGWEVAGGSGGRGDELGGVDRLGW